MRYFVRKIAFFLATLWAAITLNFIIPRLQPGDPAEVMVQKLAGKDAQLNPAAVQAMRAMLGAPDGNLFTQYVSYLGALAHGDFGISYTYYPYPVTEVIGQALPWTLVLVGVTQILAFVIGITLGAYAAWRRNTRFDSIVTLGSTFIGTLPSFWIALLLLFVFGYTVGWFPTSGGYSASTPGFNGPFITEAVSHSFLPALSLLITAPIGWILGMRNTMVMNLGEDYIRLAKAKGLPDRVVALRYAARNALLPSVTGFAIALGGVLGGSILVEQIYDYPGMGRLMGEAIGNRDFPLLQTLLLFIIVGVLLANLVADLLYGVLDPRARRAQS
ncbi:MULTISPECIES: ABC transporter permease [unclassified Phycicoccus]|uniref:ABC transporter permease n=1 Tax=unclassified Phycicoccus TaxID=2637926 RepID=UPI000702B0C5|nr:MULTISPECIES: ABC transporter permease [unclassified Phycicoccus]KQU67549.1 peptide ABC transporter permease [Phycicoccus sp. Root101]KQZ90226.1 peptide ABC transporter permease [Phycicoccus sp. Root563]